MSMLNEAKRGSLTDDRDRSFMGKVREIVPWKGDSLKEVLRKLVFIVSMGVLIYWCYTAYVYFTGSKSVLEEQKNLADLFETPIVSDNTNIENPAASDQTDNPSDNNPVLPENGSDDSPAEDTPVQAPEMLPNFEKLYALNPDIVGFLKIDGIYNDDGELSINFPVVQGDDNDYYLSHTFMKEEAEEGAVYADWRANMTGIGHSSNITIYGHNMKAEYAFHHLRDYNRTSPSFVSDHRLIYFSSLYEESEYIVIGFFFVSTNEEDDNQPLFPYHNSVEFNTMADFDYWYKNVMYRNYYTTDIDCTIDDEYLTLSTCSFEITDSRYVLVARKLRPGEDPDSYTYKSNPDRHMPKKWYTAKGQKAPVDDGPDYEYYVPEE